MKKRLEKLLKRNSELKTDNYWFRNNGGTVEICTVGGCYSERDLIILNYVPAEDVDEYLNS